MSTARGARWTPWAASPRGASPPPPAPPRGRPSFARGAPGPPRLPLLFLLAWSLLRRVHGELGASLHDLSNFQGKHACAREVMMARPRTVAEVREVVAAFPRARAVGVGHSWHPEVFCAGDDASAVNVLTSDVRSVKPPRASSPRRGLLGAARRERLRLDAVADRAVVDERAGTVRVDAGVTLRDLLDFLAAFDGGEEDADHLLSPTTSRGRRRRASTSGYTLPAFPWFIDQTVGGAIATATHGSSLRHGSLSQQTVAVTLVLANATVVELRDEAFYDEIDDTLHEKKNREGLNNTLTKNTDTDADTFRGGSRHRTPAHLFDAARASVGRLGVVVDVTLKLAPNRAVRKVRRAMDPFELAETIEAASDAVERCERALAPKKLGDPDAWACAMSDDAFRALDETQVFWFFPLGKVVAVTYEKIETETTEAAEETDGDDAPPLDASAAASAADARASPTDVSSAAASSNDASLAARSFFTTVSGASPSRGALRSMRRFVGRQPSDAPRDVTRRIPLFGNGTLSRFWARQWEESTRTNVDSGLFRARDAYLTMTEAQYDAHDEIGYDQYEFCVPMRRAGRCARALARATTDPETGEPGGLADAFRSQALVRFVGEESAFLSPSHRDAAGACMYVNVEDFVRYTNRDGEDLVANEKFHALARTLRSSACRGRRHWGKAGWPRRGCWEGAKEFGDAWCAFGCAARALDPHGKFRPSSTDALDPFRVSEQRSTSPEDEAAAFFSSSRGARCCDASGRFAADADRGCACAAVAEPRGVDAETGEACGVRWDEDEDE